MLRYRFVAYTTLIALYMLTFVDIASGILFLGCAIVEAGVIAVSDTLDTLGDIDLGKVDT